MGGLLQLQRDASALSGTGQVDRPPAALLPLEAVGPPRLPGASRARCQSRARVEHGEIRAWSLAFEPEPCVVHRLTESVLRCDGVTGAFRPCPARLTRSAEPPST